MKKFTIEEVKDGLKRCVKEDCDGCPFEILPMIDCEIALLGLAYDTIELYEGKIENKVNNERFERKNKGRRRRR